MTLGRFLSSLPNTNLNYNTLGQLQFTPHGSSGIAVLLNAENEAKKIKNTEDCFTISTSTHECFNLSVSESDCFYIKKPDEKEIPLPGTVDLSPFGIQNIYAIHAQGLLDLFVACMYQPDDETEPFLALVKILYVKSVQGGLGSILGVLDVTNIENDGIIDSGEIRGITGYDNKGLSDFFISYGADDCTSDVYIYNSVSLHNSNILEHQTGLIGFGASGWLTKNLLFAYEHGECDGLVQILKTEVGTACPSTCGAGAGSPSARIVGVNSFTGAFETTDILREMGKLEPASGSCPAGSNLIYSHKTAMVRDDLLLGDYATMSASEGICFYNSSGAGRSAQVSDGDFHYINDHHDYKNPTGSYRACWDGRFLLTWDKNYGVKVTDLTDGWSNTFGTGYEDHTLSYGVLLTVDGSSTITQELMGDIVEP